MNVQLAIKNGRIKIDGKKAIILAPKDVDKLSNDEWLTLLKEASEWIKELELLGFTVKP